MINNLITKIREWWNSMFDYDKIKNDFGLDIETSKELMDAVQDWSRIYNGCGNWLNKEKNIISLQLPKTISEKIAEAVVNEFKYTCTEPTVDKFIKKFMKNLQENVELMVGKSFIYFKPYFDGTKISISVIQADKFIPVKFSDDGELLSCIIIDQITEEGTLYTRLEYSEIKDNVMTVKNIAYKGRKDGVILSSKIDLKMVDKWKDIEPIQSIEGIDRLIGGFATVPVTNLIDNYSPIGMPVWFKALDTIKEVDKQFSRILWEFEGTELALDVDETILEFDSAKNEYKMPSRNSRLFRKFAFGEEDKKYNVYSPEIRETPLFNGLNEELRLVEVQCHLEHGTLCKAEVSPKTAQEIRQMKQSFYTTVSNIQGVIQTALDDLVYGIYVLCKLYGIQVQSDYSVEYDWDDSILVDKDSQRNSALLERNNKITSDVQYIMETRNMKEKEAVEFVKRQLKYRQLTEEDTKEEEVPE